MHIRLYYHIVKGRIAPRDTERTSKQSVRSRRLRKVGLEAERAHNEQQRRENKMLHDVEQIEPIGANLQGDRKRSNDVRAVLQVRPGSKWYQLLLV